MYASDRKFLSRFALDQADEYSWDDLEGLDFSYPDDDKMDPFDDQNIPDDDFPFKK